MGAVKGALEIFQQGHAWEDVVYCYQSLGWHAKVKEHHQIINIVSCQTANICEITKSQHHTDDKVSSKLT